MPDVLFLGSVGPTELIVILILVLILFGAKRIPEIAQGLGKGIREFKRAMHEVESEIETPPRPKTSESGQAEKKKNADQDG